VKQNLQGGQNADNSVVAEPGQETIVETPAN
jgi:hypothetical protein